jgi:hypothetical protein
MKTIHLGLAAIALIATSVSTAVAGFIEAHALDTTVTHDGGFGGPKSQFTFATPLAVSPPTQVNNTITGEGPFAQNTSSGKAGISYFSTSSQGTVRFALGTGVSQSAPAGGNDPASLRINFVVDFSPDDNSTDWLYGGYKFPLTGTVSRGGFVEFILDATMTCRQHSNFSLPQVVFSRRFSVDWVNPNPGAFSVLLSEFNAVGRCPGYLGGPAGATEYSMDIDGSIEFRARNDGGPTSIEAPEAITFDSEITPVPEPSTLALAIGGLLATVLFLGWRPLRRRQ